MSFSPRTIETLVDLVENKLSYLDITDREDRAEMKLLQRALIELKNGVRVVPRGGAAPHVHH
ncbi:hypothetical protein GCM10011611_63690 [Aliidongia dinghuensis]|uniref:Uncharacterized protein n=1 Tax=Aliidongia dinghuensis TaxID=1867774 RepID=A0A8J2Z008_9PROT|nr:hypothetical protein [Aliidongia dinghuensis]GGF48552.1 hypothetical protein GCM10011611_63690 [Aliidongia dinghuensis]